MARTIATAKTPTVAVARVLRGLGLVQGTDFKVAGEYRGSGLNRERVGTYVVIYNAAADKVVADNADAIEAATLADGGFAFRVSIHYTSGGRLWTHVANFGQRTREERPADAVEGYTVPADTRRHAKQIEARPGRTGAPKILDRELPTASADSHPYDGATAQRWFGSLLWACQTAGLVWFFQNTRNSPRYTLSAYRGRAMARGWYLTGQGVAREGVWLGKTLTEAALAAEDTISKHAWIAARMESAGRQWPKGTRVQGLDSRGVARTGTVNGVDVGMVVEPGHDNYGRTFVGVNWDEIPGDMGTNRRGRPFTDTLDRI